MSSLVKGLLSRVVPHQPRHDFLEIAGAEDVFWYRGLEFQKALSIPQMCQNVVTTFSNSLFLSLLVRRVVCAWDVLTHTMQVSVYACVCVRVCVVVHTNIHTHIYMCAYMHTYKHTNTYGRAPRACASRYDHANLQKHTATGWISSCSVEISFEILPGNQPSRSPPLYSRPHGLLQRLHSSSIAGNTRQDCHRNCPLRRLVCHRTLPRTWR